VDVFNNTVCAAKLSLDVDRSRDEAHLLFDMEHPNIIRALDFFQHAGYSVLLMPLVDTTLFHYMRHVPFGSHVMLEMMLQKARGLVYMHGRGILHLDIKPENIGVSVGLPDAPQCRFLDFGSSVHIDRVRPGHTFHVTPYFRAPELLLGCILPASDVYSLGKVFDLFRHHVSVSLLTGDSVDWLDLLVLSMSEEASPNSRPSASRVLDCISERDFHDTAAASVCDGLL